MGIKSVVRELEGFTSAAWWQANIDDLNACGFHGSAGTLSAEEEARWRQGDYSFNLLGNHQMRLALIPDPCYQAGYGGSNAFLLYRKNGTVFVTQVLNGYFSRVDNSLGLDFANLNGRQLIEVSAGNSFPPSLVSYYFMIDPGTYKAIPRNIFREGQKLTNQIYSAMLLGEPKDLGLPKNASELRIITGNRLARTFSAYEEDEQGKIDIDGRKLRRTVYRWNGRYYTIARR